QVSLRQGARYVPRLERCAAESITAPFTISPDSSYLVTGGLGALGLRTAQWLAQKGARHLYLLSRRAASPAQQSVLKELETAGVRVTPIQADVADREHMASVFHEHISAGPELRGVIHAAGL